MVFGGIFTKSSPVKSTHPSGSAGKYVGTPTNQGHSVNVFGLGLFIVRGIPGPAYLCR